MVDTINKTLVYMKKLDEIDRGIGKKKQKACDQCKPHQRHWQYTKKQNYLNNILILQNYA